VGVNEEYLNTTVVIVRKNFKDYISLFTLYV